MTWPCPACDGKASDWKHSAWLRCRDCGLTFELQTLDSGVVFVVRWTAERVLYPRAMNPAGAEDEDPVVRRFALLEIDDE